MFYEFDVLVIGMGVGGLAFAREASFAGKNVAVINVIKEDDEEEGEEQEGEEGMQVEPDIMKDILESLMSGPEEYADEEAQGEHIMNDQEQLLDISSPPPKLWSSKVVKMDSKIIIQNYAKTGRKILRNMGRLGESIVDAESCGWEVKNPGMISAHWTKLTNQVRNFILKENWRLINDFRERAIQYFVGVAEFVDSHSVKLMGDDDFRIITADYICISLIAAQLLPRHLPGIRSFGIATDYFLLIDEPPGETLVVGNTPVVLECAGIIASFGFPVTVMFEHGLLPAQDRNIVKMIVEDMKGRNVKFLRRRLLSVRLNDSQERLIARYTTKRFAVGGPEEAEFDTILFYSSDRRLNTEQLKLETVSNIFAVGQRYYPERDEVLGRIIARNLFLGEKQEIEGYVNFFPPRVILTPVEYAYNNLADSKVFTFKRNKSEVLENFFKPIELIVPYKRGKCYIKVFSEKDRILGIHVFGPDAGEIIQGFALAMRCGLTTTQLGSLLGVHGTKAEEIPRLRPCKRIKIDPHAPNKPTRITSTSSIMQTL